MLKGFAVGNCGFVTWIDYLIKNTKNPDGLVRTIFGGRNPKVGVNHVKLVVSLYYYVVLVYFFCLHDDDDYECNTNVLNGEKITKSFIFADLLNAL